MSAAVMGQLLHLLGEGGIRSTAELARRLNLSEGVVGLMIEDLTRRGYLTPLDAGCSSGCAGCGQAASCSLGAKPPILALTEKGRRASA